MDADDVAEAFQHLRKAASAPILAFLILRQRNLRYCNRACRLRRPTGGDLAGSPAFVAGRHIRSVQQLRIIRPCFGHVLAAVGCLMMRLISRCAGTFRYRARTQRQFY